jgi:hypothetical protein
LLPTTPEKVHVWPRLFVQVAVAVDPTVRQATERLVNSLCPCEEGAARVRARRGRRPRYVVFMRKDNILFDG